MQYPMREFETERLSREGREPSKAGLAVERTVEIVVNGRVILALAALPGMERELGAGFLSSSGLLRKREGLRGISFDEGTGRIEVEAEVLEEDLEGFRERMTLGSSCGGAVGERYRALGTECREKFNLFTTTTRDELLGVFSEFIRLSATYRETRGVHSAAAYRGRERIAFAEDIGRHNAVDKVLGACFLAGEKTSEMILFTTGRLTSEVVLKAARHGVPVLASRSVATDAAVGIAREAQLALVGACTRERATVYSAFWRIRK
ncbi:MAG: formate dehydrogenase accessory sulfurtransferase FdhD [Planctomycetota bacterium]